MIKIKDLKTGDLLYRNNLNNGYFSIVYITRDNESFINGDEIGLIKIQFTRLIEVHRNMTTKQLITIKYPNGIPFTSEYFTENDDLKNYDYKRL